MAKNHNYYIHIVSSINKTLYIGVTNNLLLRISQHPSGSVPGFTQKYHIKQLVYYEYFTDIHQAIAREKELKKWRRGKKIALITSKIVNGKIYFLRLKKSLPTHNKWPYVRKISHPSLRSGFEMTTKVSFLKLLLWRKRTNSLTHRAWSTAASRPW